MNFEDRVKFIRSLPQFRVAPISEIRAVAFAAKEEGDVLIGRISSNSLYLDSEDIEKILHEYPHLEAVLS